MTRLPWLAAALVVATATPALARPACRIVVDARGDEFTAYDVEPPVERPEVDIVSGDIATSATHMTTVVRVASLPRGATFGSTTSYIVLIEGGEAFVRTHVTLLSDGTAEGVVERYDVGASNNTASSTPLGPAKASVDRSKAEIRATFPLSLVKQYVNTRKGAAIRVRHLQTTYNPGAAPAPELDDGAMSYGTDRGEDGPRIYRAGSASCVKVGS